MSRPCDEQGEMPERSFLDDDTLEAILAGLRDPNAVEGRRPSDGGVDLLVEFASDVRATVERPAPRPAAALATVLVAGFSTGKGYRLVTAASNVNGPAAQAAGLPKWRKQHTMIPAGLLSGLLGKIAAGACAGLVGVTAAGAAGALPGPAQNAVAHVVEAVTPFDLPGAGHADLSADVTVTTNALNAGLDAVAGTGGSAPSADASLGASAGNAGASANASANLTGANAGAHVNSGLPASASGVPGLPNLPAVPNLPNVQIPSCVRDIVDVNTGQPKVPLSQVAPQVINCVRTLLATSGVDLPASTDQCINAVLGLVGTVTANPGSVPNLGSFDASACIPIDITECMSSVFGMVSGFMPGGGGGIPGLSGINLDGCMPFNLDQCLSSIFTMVGNLPGLGLGGIPGLGAGTLPSLDSLDLGSCVPFGSLGSFSGFGGLRR